MKTDNRKKIDNIEMVETYNIALALRRCRSAPGWDNERTSRALVHAVGMAGGFSYEEKRLIREVQALMAKKVTGRWIRRLAILTADTKALRFVCYSATPTAAT